ncbi:MAG TPA: bifunctional aldolase/short-chain dehydrogenase [Candidatus Krumholzibacteria bacterium]|nr:bifunctional aldolase/short-chain dehydrogenase [Candidatus Krumholzibacteria bacterium]
MRSLWNDSEAKARGNDALSLRVYTSRLIGRESSLVLSGGGNTSVKARAADLFGETTDILYVKGSGWDLAGIEPAGFAPLRLDAVRRMAELPSLTDSKMVAMLKSLSIDPAAPAPSVEAILHAIIPSAFVDHTHADAVVTITNTPEGMHRIGEIYGDRIFIVPYVMPGFELAREVFEMTRDVDWAELEGIILMHHGVFTFGDDARSSYERMIQIVSEAESYLELHAPLAPSGMETDQASAADLRQLARARRAVSRAAGGPMFARVDTGAEASLFAANPDAPARVSRGPLTPDHVIRTKRVAWVMEDDVDESANRFVAEYRKYFERNTDGSLTCLDPAPRWALWPGRGIVAFGRSHGDLNAVSDIVAHTLPAIERAEQMGGWKALPEDAIFDVEYWELEQAKLTRAPKPAELAGRVALVTGAASGIGRACVEAFLAGGASVVAIDRNDAVSSMFDEVRVCGFAGDVTDAAAVEFAVESAIRRFGGLDAVVSNAGVFPESARIAELSGDIWQKSLAVNLDAHRILLQKTIPFLELGIDPAVVIIGSKNVPAPGRGAAAYSVAKAGLTQLARVAALELAASGIRVNVLHPNDVFDTAIWTPDVLAARAKEYGMDVETYRRRNLLGVEVTSADVAELAVALTGRLFAKTTGAQIPVDGGNDRVV